MTRSNRIFLALAPAAAATWLTTSGAAAADIPDTIAAADPVDGAPVAVAIGGDHETIVAGARTIRRLDAIGDTVARVTMPSEVVDLAADAESHGIAVLREDAVVVLDDALTVVWERPLDRATATGRIAIGEAGTVAVVTGDRVRAYDARGVQWLSSRASLDELTGVAVLDDTGAIVVGGSRRVRACGAVVDEPALVAIDRDGGTRWDAWNDVVRDCHARSGDARVVDVRRGGDGMAYVLVATEGRSALLPAGTARAVDGAADEPSHATARGAWFARLTPRGTITDSGWLAVDEAFASVRVDAIDADVDGNVFLVGAATHERDDAGFVEATGSAIGFFAVLAPTLDGARVWRQFAVDDLDGEAVRMAVDGDRAVAIVPATSDAAARVVVLPTLPEQTRADKQPDRDDVGTFGYESGVSGADPTCYCDARRTTAPSWWAAAVVVIALARPRRRRS